MNDFIQVSVPLEVGMTRESYVKQVFDIATAKGDQLSVTTSDGKTTVAWSRGFGAMYNEILSKPEQAYQAARIYNITLNLSIAEPNIQ